MQSFPRWIILLISAIIFIAFAIYFINIVTYLIIAGILSLVGQPLMEFIAARKIRRFSIPRSIASLITMGLMALIFLLLIAILIPLIVKQANTIASIDVAKLSAIFAEPVHNAESFLFNIGALEDVPLNQYIQQRLRDIISFTNISNLFGTVMGVTGNIFIAFFSISFILFFFLKEKGLFFRIISALVPGEHETKMDTAFNGVKKLLTRYFLGILLQISILAVVIGTGLAIVGVKSALLIAFFAAFLNIIPYIGVIIGVIFGIILSIAEVFPIEMYPDMAWLALKVAIVFGCAQMLDNLVLQPFIFSSSVRAHPLEIFLIILAGGTAGGVFGMVLAVPAYTVVRVMAKEFFSEFKIVQKLTGKM